MMDAPPRSSEPPLTQLHKLTLVLAEDALFALSAGRGDPFGALEGMGRRRAEAYGQFVRGSTLPSMTETYEPWVASLSRALAPIAPPVWVPMMEVVREKVSLEIGARGFRALFSSKPSEKDVQRVLGLAPFIVRALRAVLSSDGELDQDDRLSLAALLAAMGLSGKEYAELLAEPPLALDSFEPPAEMSPSVALAIVSGLWHAAANDTIDPREEEVLRSIGGKLAVRTDDFESARADALSLVESRRFLGTAAVDAIRFVLSDRMPGMGVKLAVGVGQMLLPRRYRDEVLAQVGHGAPVVLTKRHAGLSAEGKASVLGMTWAACLHENPSVSRRVVLRSRWQKLAADLGDASDAPRLEVDRFVESNLLAFCAQDPA